MASSRRTLLAAAGGAWGVLRPVAARDAATLSLVEAALRQQSVGPDTAYVAVRGWLRLQLVPAE